MQTFNNFYKRTIKFEITLIKLIELFIISSFYHFNERMDQINSVCQGDINSSSQS